MPQGALFRQPLSLWEVPARYHCSILGTCLGLAELRRVAGDGRVQFSATLSDYDLHGLMASQAQHASVVGKLLQKAIAKKYEASVRSFAHASSAEEILTMWRRALVDGNVPGSYWALMTHPLADEEARDHAFGDVHMLSHVVGSSNRSDLARLRDLNAKLLRTEQSLHEARRSVKRAVVDNGVLARQLDQESEARRRVEGELKEAHRELRQQEASARLEEALGLVRELEGRLALESDRAAELERKASETLRIADDGENRMAELESAMIELREENAHLEETLSAFLSRERGEDAWDAKPATCSPRTDPCPHRDLCGMRVLYVGGRPNLVCHYRELVERRGGEFVHHDGGNEERIGRLRQTLPGVHVVLCPIDCVSHDACLQVKQICKSYVRPFVPLRTSGLSSLAKALGNLEVAGR